MRSAFDRRTRGRRYTPVVRSWWSVVAGLALVSSAAAQYGFDPSGGDRNARGIRYFGSVKDEGGSFLEGATIVLTGALGRWIFVTNEEGRFHGNLPTEMAPERTSPTCFKPGFMLVQLTKRPGAAGGRSAVQVDCVLRPADR